MLDACHTICTWCRSVIMSEPGFATQGLQGQWQTRAAHKQEHSKQAQDLEKAWTALWTVFFFESDEKVWKSRNLTRKGIQKAHTCWWAQLWGLDPGPALPLCSPESACMPVPSWTAPSHCLGPSPVPIYQFQAFAWWYPLFDVLGLTMSQNWQFSL